ncbi:hypothetical protein CRG98_025312 [Punica granatum]|uniref:Uncharacterized protein n=1 Tax=Punica granatum TaxID=22663 RepID=A0A2I0JDJ1_PUNGR|nr:hypothetical protein CRG98_025312 [Punica granatum]
MVRVQSMNRAARLFNSNLVSLVNDLPARLPHSHVVVVNAYKIIRDILKNPSPKGRERDILQAGWVDVFEQEQLRVLRRDSPVGSRE